MWADIVFALVVGLVLYVVVRVWTIWGTVPYEDELWPGEKPEEKTGL